MIPKMRSNTTDNSSKGKESMNTGQQEFKMIIK